MTVNSYLRDRNRNGNKLPTTAELHNPPADNSIAAEKTWKKSAARTREHIQIQDSKSQAYE